MSIQTAVSSPHDTTCKPQRTYDDIILRPGDSVESRIITVDEPIHIFGMLPRDMEIRVERVYGGVNNECNDIPDLPVPCASGVLMNDGSNMVTEMWITHKGSYRFIYQLIGAGTAPTVIPDGIYVWFIKDDSIEGCCNGC